jgi:translation initiation factor IF-3
VNERIRAREVRVIDEEGKQLGIMAPFEALKMARTQGLDLVEVAPAANPPVCRIINYGKYLYQLSKRQHEARKHQKSIELKEVKFRPRTSAHDFEVKRDHIVEFLREGSKVKATVMFRGREMAHRDLGMRMMERLFQEIAEVGQVEARPRQEGPFLTAILAPNKKVVAKGSVAKPRAASDSATAPAQAKLPPRPQPESAKAAVTPETPESAGG